MKGTAEAHPNESSGGIGVSRVIVGERVAILGCAVALAVCGPAPSPGAPHARGSKNGSGAAIQHGKLIAARIKHIADEEANSDPALVDQPSFIVDGSRKELRYYMGGIRSEYSGLAPDDPYRLPLETQIYVEALRKSLRGSAIPSAVWRGTLNKVDGLIFQTIQDIDATPNKNKLLHRLSQRRTQINREFTRLEAAILRFADLKGYDVSKSRGVTTGSFQVDVATEPPGGRVRVLTTLAYQKCLALNTPRDHWPWRDLVQKKEDLIGKYHYVVQWPNGKRAESDIEIRNNSPVTFRAEQ